MNSNRITRRMNLTEVYISIVDNRHEDTMVSGFYNTKSMILNMMFPLHDKNSISLQNSSTFSLNRFWTVFCHMLALQQNQWKVWQLSKCVYTCVSIVSTDHRLTMWRFRSNIFSLFQWNSECYSFYVCFCLKFCTKSTWQMD